MAERRYDISNDIGIQHSTLIASDEGFTIQPEELRRRKIHHDGIERALVTGVTGAATSAVNPYDIRPQKTDEWAKILAVQAAHSDLLLIQRNMLRHRAVTRDGKVFLFQQGKGQIARMGSVSDEEEWICIEKHFIAAWVNGPDARMVNDYVMIRPGQLPNPAASDTALVVVDNAHVQAKSWAVGQIALLDTDGRQSRILSLDSEVVYATEHLTEVIVRDQLLHIVHARQVWGVLEP